MSKIKFTFLILFVLLITAWAIAFGGNNILLYVDIPSLAVTVLAPYIIATFTFSFSEQVEINRELLKKDGPYNKEVLNRAIIFLNALKKLTITASIFGFLIGFIGIMSYLAEETSRQTLSMWFGVTAICPFYTVIFIMAIIEPLITTAKKNLLN